MSRCLLIEKQRGPSEDTVAIQMQTYIIVFVQVAGNINVFQTVSHSVIRLEDAHSPAESKSFVECHPKSSVTILSIRIIILVNHI